MFFGEHLWSGVFPCLWSSPRLLGRCAHLDSISCWLPKKNYFKNCSVPFFILSTSRLVPSQTTGGHVLCIPKSIPVSKKLQPFHPAPSSHPLRVLISAYVANPMHGRGTTSEKATCLVSPALQPKFLILYLPFPISLAPTCTTTGFSPALIVYLEYVYIYIYF